MNLNTNFTPRLRHVLATAPVLAGDLGHKYVGTEHLLLSLAAEENSLAASFLERHGVHEARLRECIIAFSGTSTPTQLSSADLTPRAREMIESAARSAETERVGSDVLLLALLSERESTAVRLLATIGVDASALCRELRAFHDERKKNSIGTSVLAALPKLSRYGKDLTAAARDGLLDPLIGREEETARAIAILSRRVKNNPCLIGEPGVGKTAIAEGLASRIVRGTVPRELRSAAVISLDLSSMIAGAKYRGEFEERLRGVLDEIRTARNIILFIDEVHTIVGAGAAEGAVDAANILKPALSRGEIRLLGATTPKEYRASIEKDSALSRRFAPIFVKEPSEKEALTVLRGLKSRYEAHHDLRFTEDALLAAVSLSVRYLPERFLPDKAIDLLDEAAAEKRVRTGIAPLSLTSEKSEMRLPSCESTVTAEDIAEVLYRQTGIPVSRLTEDGERRFTTLEAKLSQVLIGQDSAVRALSRALLRRRSGIGSLDRPLGCFLFLGSPGVGKTAMATALAEHLFGGREGLLRFDMSEYMEKHSVSRLIGSPPGYVGYGEGGLLSEGIRRHPYAVVLFDEIEKAHPDVMHLLLQIMEEGRLTDSEGHLCNFRNAIIVCTANLSVTVGTHVQGFVETDAKAIDDNSLRAGFRPEFLSRFDEIIRFSSPTEKDLERIADGMLKELSVRALGTGLSLSYTESVAKHLAEIASKQKDGARGVRRALAREVEDGLALALLEGRAAKGHALTVDVKDGNIVFLSE